MRERTQNIIEEVEWLFSFDVHPVDVAHQLGLKTDTLAQLLKRNGRPDLGSPFQAERTRERRAA